MIQEQKLDFWVANKLNVLFTGKPGVGKTAIVKSTFEKNGLSYQYFSAPTMDPWVDFIGVPKESVDENGVKYLDIVRPKMFAFDEVNALFFDELNRAPAKVRNAVMELIQFKSINGKVFKNLKFVWAAINPEDEEGTYDVERLDPAQKDRFQVHIDIDYKPDKKYFFEKFGAEKGKAAIEWWDNIIPELKDSVTPRRLDYAIEMFNMGGDIYDVLPKKVNITKLASMLSNGLASDKIVYLHANGKDNEISEMLNDDNIYAEVEKWIIATENNNDYIFGLLPAERLVKFISNCKADAIAANTMQRIIKNYHSNARIREITISYMNSSNDNKVKAMIIEAIPVLKSNNVGKSPVIFKATASENSAFTQLFETVVKMKEYQKEPNIARIIAESQNIPHNVSSKDAKLVIESLVGCIKHLSSAKVKENIELICGPLNFALQKNNVDIRVKENLGLESKTVMNKLITAGVERFVWIPNS